MSAQSRVSGREFKAVFYYLIPTVLSNALPLISLPFLTRELTPTQFGLIAIIQVFSMVVFAFTNFGLASSFERNYFQYKSRTQIAALTWSCFAYLFFTGLLVSAASHLATPVIERYVVRSDTPVWTIFFGLLAAHLRGANDIAYRYLRNAELPRSFAAIAVGEGVTSFGLTLVLVIGLGAGVRGYFIAQMMASLVGSILLAIRISTLLKPRLDGLILREALLLGAPLTLRGVLGLVASQLDKYLLSLIGSLAAVGIYSIGQRVAQSVFVIMNAFDFVFIPKIYRMMFEAKGADTTDERASEVPFEIGRFLTPFVFATALVCLGIALFSEEALFVLAAPTFHQSIEIAGVLCLSYASMIFGKVNGRQVMFARKPRLSVWLALVAIVTTAAISVPIVMARGLEGAAWATLISTLLNAIVCHWQAQKCFRIRWEYRTVAAIFGFTFSAVLLHVSLLHFEVNYVLRLIVKIVLVSIFAIVGVRSGYLPLGAIKREVLRRLGK